jgi:hypothetical protein
MLNDWYELTCSKCNKIENIPFNESPYTCYDCKMELEYGPILRQIMDILKEKDGLTTEEISDKINKDYHNTNKLLEYLQCEVKIKCLFDDEVTNENRWYLR